MNKNEVFSKLDEVLNKLIDRSNLSDEEKKSLKEFNSKLNEISKEVIIKDNADKASLVVNKIAENACKVVIGSLADNKIKIGIKNNERHITHKEWSGYFKLGDFINRFTEIFRFELEYHLMKNLTNEDRANLSHKLHELLVNSELDDVEYNSELRKKRTEILNNI